MGKLSEKELERKRKYQEANKEKVLEWIRRYQEKNKEKFLESKRRYREANKEKISESGRRYREANKDKYRAWKCSRYAKKQELPATLTADEWREILDRHFGRCHYCGKKTEELEQEHMKPVSKGGGYTKENIVPACRSCNGSKYTKSYKEFIKNNRTRLQLDLFK